METKHRSKILIIFHECGMGGHILGQCKVSGQVGGVAGQGKNPGVLCPGVMVKTTVDQGEEMKASCLRQEQLVE